MDVIKRSDALISYDDLVTLRIFIKGVRETMLNPETTITLDLTENDVIKLYQLIRITGQKNASAAVSDMINRTYYQYTLCDRVVYSEKLPNVVYLALKKQSEDDNRGLALEDFQMVLNAVNYIQHDDPVLYAGLADETKKDLKEFRDDIILKAAEAVRASRS